eukprot:5994518-Pyramimonas_sp.AAC.1
MRRRDLRDGRAETIRARGVQWRPSALGLGPRPCAPCDLRRLGYIGCMLSVCAWTSHGTGHGPRVAAPP